MSCDSKNSTLEYLRNKNIIDDRDIVLNRAAFSKESVDLIELAEYKYGVVNEMPFAVKRGVATPNVKFFKSIDSFSEVMAEKPSNVFTYEVPEEVEEEIIDENELSEKEIQEKFEKEVKDDLFEERRDKFETQEARYAGILEETVKTDKMILEVHDVLSIIVKDEKSEYFKGKANVAKRKIGKEIKRKGKIKAIEKLNALNYYNSINYYFSFLENQSVVVNNKIKDILDNKERSTSRRTSAYKAGQTYLSSFNLMEDVQKLIVKLHQSDSHVISNEKFEELQSKFKSISSTANVLKENLDELNLEILMATLGNSKYYGEEYTKMKAAAEIRANSELGNAAKDENARALLVSKFLFEQKEVIEKRTKDAFRKLLENPQYDVSDVTGALISDANINNPFVQIAYRILLESEDNYKNAIQPVINMLNNLDKEHKLTKKNWIRITERDHNNKLFLIGTTIKTLSSGEIQLENGYKAEYYSRVRELKKNIALANSVDDSVKEKKAKEKLKAFMEKNTTTVGGKLMPIKKWETDISNLSKGEIAFLIEFQKITKSSHQKMDGKLSLYRTEKKLYGRHVPMTFFEVPKMLETNFSKYMRGDLFGGTKKTLLSMFTKEVDDVVEARSISMEEVRNQKGSRINWALDKNEPERIHQNLGGKDKNALNINYRNDVYEEQNMDLLTVYVKELENAEKYVANKNIEGVMTMLIEAVGSSKFYKTEGIFKKLQIAFGKDETLKNYEVKEGKDSIVYKKLISMMENNVYEITSKYAGKIKGSDVDINRMTSSFIAYSSYLGMALKIPGAVNNMFLGNIQNFIEQAGGEFTNLKSTKRAYAIYGSNFGGLLNDIGKPFKTNFVNQIMSVYDTGGDYSQLSNQYERNSRYKQLAESSSLFGLYSAGEHEMQGTLTLSIMEGIKVLNADGNFINKKGEEVVSKGQAASLLDMYYKEKSTGELKLRDTFTYTSIDYINKFSEGGRLSVKALLKDRIFRAHGIYDVKRQSDFQRNWYGKLFLHYKKYFESALLNRFRGLGHSGTKTDELRDSEKYFNYSTKAEEFGYYTTFIRTIRQSISKHKFDIIGHIQEARIKNKPLTEHQLANMKKAQIELSIIVSMISLASIFVAAAQDDEDNDLLWKGAYYARRIQNELTQYFLAPEMIRIAKNPIASIAQFNTLTKLFGAALSPWGWYDTYKTGVNAGKSKDAALFQKAILPKSQFLGYDVQYKKMYNFFDSLD